VRSRAHRLCNFYTTLIKNQEQTSIQYENNDDDDPCDLEKLLKIGDMMRDYGFIEYINNGPFEPFQRNW